MNKKIFTPIIIIIIFFIKISSADAFMELPSLYKGIRPLGMGNAFVAVVNDENSSFYNPAGISKFIPDYHVEIFNPAISASNNSLELITKVQGIDFKDEKKVSSFLKSIAKKHQYLNVTEFSNITIPYFQAGYLARATSSIFVGPKGSSSLGLDTNIIFDRMIVVTTGYAFFEKMFALGVSLKSIDRIQLNKFYSPSEISDTENFKISQDMEDNFYRGYSIDAGMQLEFKKISSSPMLGLVIHNMGGINFTQIYTDNPEKKKFKIPPQIDAGIGFRFFNSENKRLTIAFDLFDITKENGEDKDFFKRTHTGGEFSWKFLALRTGLNQGYPTYGVGFIWRFFRLDYANYTEELGAYTGQISDIRHMFQLSLGF